MKALGVSPGNWLEQVNGIESRYYRAIGDPELLILRAEELSQCWLKGLGVARALKTQQKAA